ncbi:thiamine kinase-like enzyme [Enterococcus sp. PF1-24]|uniref:choline kinase family protein n=1 Tax=unclassified Enterococcus TaxID=2608891 RepID=UPI002476B5CE|nr:MULTISPECIES: choline kinase family protein [unclassified Enterococcus]MDH6364077.1 thiamine kinase-like enzyme [Enterococcus sp. PFB1-1]MDH6401178.1 thiamine kinase-like enzyme [Enterococcus sp. PF1-24]
MRNYEEENLSMVDSIELTITQTLQKVFNDDSLVFDRSRFAGGLTNYNYLMTIQGKDYIVREPGVLTDQMIDRDIEEYNTKAIDSFGINSKCIYFDAKTGIKISEFVADSCNLAQAEPFSKDSLQQVAGLLKKIHTSTISFKNIFSWQDELAKYEEIIEEINGALFSDYYLLKEKTFNYFEDYIANVPLVPCHNDTVPENFLVSTNKDFYLIDWEYSGLNDPNFDLAAFIIETNLPPQAIDSFLQNYYGNQISEANIHTIKGYMVAQDLMWTVWALIRHYCGDNFLDYCDMRYERFRKNILALSEDPDFPIYKMVELA